MELCIECTRQGGSERRAGPIYVTVLRCILEDLTPASFLRYPSISLVFLVCSCGVHLFFVFSAGMEGYGVFLLCWSIKGLACISVQGIHKKACVEGNRKHLVYSKNTVRHSEESKSNGNHKTSTVKMPI
jgi:hypothetical protein